MKPNSRERLTGHIVVWIARVSQAHDSLSFLEPCLDIRDQERAARFRFPEDRARFVLGRGLLRKCLGHYLQLKPETIELAYTDRDRPILPHDKTVQFSISHTHDLVAVALTVNAQIGIDLEHIRAPSDILALAKRILSEEDLQVFQALPGGEIPSAFFRIWTRKEAYLKARGEGITEGLQQISVSFSPEDTSSIKDGRDESATQKWRLINLPVPPEYAGSLACDDASKRVECNYVRVKKGEIIRDSLPRLG